MFLIVFQKRTNCPFFQEEAGFIFFFFFLYMVINLTAVQLNSWARWRFYPTAAFRRKKTDNAEHRPGARCEPCAPYRLSPLYGIDQGHPQRHSEAMAGRGKRRASRELSGSCRQSRLTDIGEINTKSPAIFLSWMAFSRHKLFIATVARYGRPSRSRGTSSSTIKRMPCARGAGFGDSTGCTSVATS